MKVSGVDFAVVFVDDYAAAVGFYRDVLGLDHLDYGKIPGGEFETGSLTLQVVEASAIGREFEPSGHPIALHVDDVEAARGAGGERCRVPRRDPRHRGLPHGPVRGPRRQRPPAPQALRAPLGGEGAMHGPRRNLRAGPRDRRRAVPAGLLPGARLGGAAGG